MSEKLYAYLQSQYQPAEPIFFTDLKTDQYTDSALNQKLKNLCTQGKLIKYDTGVYYIPKKSSLHSPIGPNADTVARYRFILRNGNIEGFYTGNTFANQLGISTQVPRTVEIVSNKTNSSPRMVTIGNRSFYVRKPLAEVTDENVYVLQMLDVLKNLDAYMDVDAETAKNKFAHYIELHKIHRSDVSTYIHLYPLLIYKHYYEMELDHVLA